MDCRCLVESHSFLLAPPGVGDSAMNEKRFAPLAPCGWLVIQAPVYIYNRWPSSTSSITRLSTFPTPSNFPLSPLGFLCYSSPSPHIRIHISASRIEGSPTQISRHRHHQKTRPHSIPNIQSQKLKVVIRSSSKPQLLFLYSFFAQALSFHNDPQSHILAMVYVHCIAPYLALEINLHFCLPETSTWKNKDFGCAENKQGTKEKTQDLFV